jgi:hypothetical protein
VNDAPLLWRAWPAAERPGQALAVGLALAAAALAGGILGGGPALGAVSFAALFLALSSYFLPTRVRIDAEGVETASFFGGVRRRAWSSLQSFADDPRGMTLSPYRRPSLLETYRGMRILYGPETDRQAVRAQVAARLARMAPRRERAI